MEEDFWNFDAYAFSRAGVLNSSSSSFILTKYIWSLHFRSSSAKFPSVAINSEKSVPSYWPIKKGPNQVWPCNHFGNLQQLQPSLSTNFTCGVASSYVHTEQPRNRCQHFKLKHTFVCKKVKSIIQNKKIWNVWNYLTRLATQWICGWAY